MSFSACREFPFIEPTPQAQTILPCLLRHLNQGQKGGSFKVGQLLAEKPHFSHCMEWLLFTVFDRTYPEKTTIFLEIFWSILMWLSVLQEKLMVDIGRICALPLGDQQSSLRNASNVDGPALLCAIYL